ncbi:MAG: aminopeptidase [Candidatus Gracilibacteria bacterium]|nr:aminopeptidase [Candidatus Gracilibacteria bacterium]
MYKPDLEILKKYADLLVNFALNHGKGVKSGQTISLQIPESAKDFLIPLQEAILKAECYPIIRYVPEGGVMRNFYENANENQLKYHPKNYMKALVKDADHLIGIIAEQDLFELKGIDTSKIMTRNKALKFYIDERKKKEEAGKQSRTLAMYGTPAMAKEANLSLEEYWQEIIKACYLNENNPAKKWQEIIDDIGRIKNILDDMNIEKIKMEGEDVDLEIKIGADRKWRSGSGANIPSFEIFTSPDWRGTNGRIKFTQPFYRNGDVIEGMELEFKNGIVTKSRAKKNEKLFKNMLAVKNADRLGEFSMTDKRFSKISKFMADTLFDENFGGEFGNNHIAIGRSFFSECYKGDFDGFTKKDWDKLGFNDSVIHSDLVITSNRTITATLQDGNKKIIYKNGEFMV